MARRLSKSQEGHPLLYTQPDLDAFPLETDTKWCVWHEDMDNEGNLMGHCVAQALMMKVLDGTIQIWSLRDKDNYPHATIELSSKEDITEYSADDFYEEAYMETEMIMIMKKIDKKLHGSLQKKWLPTHQKEQ